MKRKEFIQASALASAAMMVPGFLHSANKNFAASLLRSNKKLVVIQLTGGNDGLNTVVPYRNDVYYKMRPTIAIKDTEVLKLNDDLGFNPNLIGLKNIFDQGYMSIINDVGYPNPSRSHFRAMDIWHSASDAEQYINNGWIGRYLDSTCNGENCDSKRGAIETDDSLSLALHGKTINGLALSHPNTFYELASQEQLYRTPEKLDNDNLGFLYKTLAETQASAQYIYNQSKIYKSKAPYPANYFSNHLKTIAELIISGISTSVFYTSLIGFDSHGNQLTMQNNQFKVLSSSLEVFIDDLKKNGQLENVVVMIFSEFGRRVKQNASNGTDHGTANNVFIISEALKKPGLYNEMPDLFKLDQGDLIHKVDFRSVYATLLNKWLGADDQNILNRKFEHLNFI